jgi:tRNA threonylcarbamoyladenosine biosynthesis protein TsaE
MTMTDDRPATPSIRVISTSTEETRAFAAALALVAQPGDRLALVGPLGAGKTQFAKGFAVGLGIDEVVNSPSFTLMSEYEGRLTLFHQDLYRLAGAAEVLAGGLLDERQDLGVTVSEWADRLDDELDPSRLTILIEPRVGDERSIELGGRGEITSRYAEAAGRWQEVLP